jgi:uncharacterized protein
VSERFPLRDVPRDWHPAGRAVALLFDNLSLMIPAAERHVVLSVKAVRPDADGPGPRALCRQEGAHCREHTRYNRHLAAQGVPARALEDGTEAMMAWGRRVLGTPRRHLALSCALEHVTTVLARALLERPALLGGADPMVVALWRWHAEEEVEHRALALELFREVGGTGIERVGVMALAQPLFWGRIAAQQVQLMRAEGIAASPRAWASLARFLLVHPGGALRLLPRLLLYFRPGFDAG